MRVFQEQLRRRFPGRVIEKRARSRRGSGAAIGLLAASSGSRAVEIGEQAFAVVRVALEQCRGRASLTSRQRAGFTLAALAFLELARQPGARDRPVALHGGGGDAHRLGGLLDRQAAEEAQLDEPRLLGVESREPLERLVERDEIDRSRFSPATRPSSSVTRGWAPPRLSAPRARARSIRIWRIECAAMAQKCARFCHRPGLSLSSRR